VPRPPRMLERSEISPEDLEFYDRHAACWLLRSEDSRTTEPLAFQKALTYWPAWAAKRAEQSVMVRSWGEREGSYSHADREWINIVFWVDWGTNVQMSPAGQNGHIPIALGVGVRLEAIEALRAGREEELTDDERLLTTYIRQVASRTVTDETWDAMERRFGTVHGVVQYTMAIINMVGTILMHKAFGDPEISEEGLDELIREFREGRGKIPDNWREIACGAARAARLRALPRPTYPYPDWP
jgi:hypothetical protein